MYKQHPQFPVINNTDQLWRYMDLAKYVSLISKQEMFFCRSDKFDDPYEGMYNTSTRTALAKWFMEANRTSDFQEEEALKKADEILLLNRKFRPLTLINCWHQNQDENFAMWKVYCNGTLGLAIQTDFASLKAAFSQTTENIYIGKVKYIDEGNGLIDPGNTFAPFMSKRAKFSYENEVRCIHLISDNFNEPYDWKAEPNEYGKSLRTDLAPLIQNIYVSPNSPQWYVDAIKDLNSKYGIKAPILQSSIYTSAHYI